MNRRAQKAPFFRQKTQKEAQKEKEVGQERSKIVPEMRKSLK
jgi:hypothetical protein